MLRYPSTYPISCIHVHTIHLVIFILQACWCVFIYAIVLCNNICRHVNVAKSLARKYSSFLTQWYWYQWYECTTTFSSSSQQHHCICCYNYHTQEMEDIEEDYTLLSIHVGLSQPIQ